MTSCGVRFVLPLQEIADVEKRERTAKLQARLGAIFRSGRKINRLTVTAEGDVVYVFEGSAYYLGEAPEGAAGFSFEELAHVA